MVANIRGFTPNYSFKLINFDVPRWHTLEYENWLLVDALFLAMGTAPLRGVWQNNTLYIEGDRVFDSQTGQIFRALITHTSSPTGTFEEERDLHPDLWVLQTFGVPIYRGDWEPDVAYYMGDIVKVDDHAFYLCIDNHTSLATFAEDAADWQLIFDTPAVPGGPGTANVFIGTDPPINPQHGYMWWESDTGLMFVWYVDVDSGQWVILCPQPDLGTFVLRSGDAMTGNLGLPTAVTPGPYDAVSKTYVDSVLLNTYAPTVSPVFTGDPHAPNPPPGDNDNSIATTKWVTDEINRIRTSVASTGDVKLTLKTVADTGWVMMNDTQIGNVSSGAYYANANCRELFLLLYANIPDAYCPVSGGRSGNAETDWTANKYMALPRVLGRALAAAGGGAGLTGRALGAYFGEEGHALTAYELAIHTHGFSGSGTSSGEDFPHTHTYEKAVTAGRQKPLSSGTAPFDVYETAETSGSTAPHTHTFTVSGSTDTGSGVGGAAHNNMQPSTFLNVMIKL